MRCISDFQQGDQYDSRSPYYDDSGDEMEGLIAERDSVAGEVEVAEDTIRYFSDEVRSCGLTLSEVREVREAREVLPGLLEDLEDLEDQIRDATPAEPDYESMAQDRGWR